MSVHSRPRRSKNWLGHKGCGFVKSPSFIFHDVLVDHHLVSHLDKRIIFEIKLTLSGSADFVMLTLDLKPTFNHRLHHAIAQIHGLVDWRGREISLLVSNLIAATVFASTIPIGLTTIKVKERGVGTLVKSGFVKNEKLGFWSKISGVCNATTSQVGRRFSSDKSRVSTVVLVGDWICDIANYIESRKFREWVDKTRIWHRHQKHVAFVDLLPTSNA